MQDERLTDCNHDHGEGYNLMLYASDDRRITKRVWNARNGVTPFVIGWEGVELAHIDWHRDEKRPHHVPEIGDLVFVNLTIERAREFRRSYVEKFWDGPYAMSERWETKEEAVEELAQADMKRGQDPLAEGPSDPCRPPDMVQVDEELQRKIVARLQRRTAGRSISPRAG